VNGINSGLESISGSKSVADITESWTDGALSAAVGYYLFTDALLSGSATSKAVVLGAVPGLVGGFKKWLNEGKTLDLSASNVGFLLSAFLTYCLHTGSIMDGDLALKIVASLNLINGLGGMFAPDLVAKLPWSGAGSATVAAGVGAAVLALSTGSSASQALAYSVVPSLFKSIDAMFISKDGSGDQNVAALMTLFQVAVVATNIA